MKFSPFSSQEMLEAFHGESMSSKHILLIYSIIIGTNAQIILDLGLGNSTRVSRAAAKITGGKVYSCDMDSSRFASLESEGDEHWRFFCMKSDEMLKMLPGPFDFVFHDASHIHDEVRNDLLVALPKMRQFGIVCIHDTQQPRYTLLDAIYEAVDHVSSSQDVSMLTLPYSCGLTVLRVETSKYPPIEPAGRLRGERVVTVPKRQRRTAPV